MARSQSRHPNSDCPRCATVMDRGTQVCPICRLDVTSPAASPSPEPVVTHDAAPEPATASPDPVTPDDAAPATPPAGPVLLPLTASAGTDPYASIPAGYAPVGRDEPTPLAPDELLAPVWSITEGDVAPLRLNPKDPFSWAPVVHA